MSAMSRRRHGSRVAAALQQRINSSALIIDEFATIPSSADHCLPSDATGRKLHYVQTVQYYKGH